MQLSDRALISSLSSTCAAVFLLAAVYYIHSLYFSQAPSRHRQHTLRPLSLLNHRMSGTNNVEYAESPTSTAPSASLPHPSRSSRVGSGTGWKVKALGAGSGSGFASSLTSAEMPISGWRLAEPALLAIAAAVVGICGIVDTIRVSIPELILMRERLCRISWLLVLPVGNVVTDRFILTDC